MSKTKVPPQIPIADGIHGDQTTIETRLAKNEDQTKQQWKFISFGTAVMLGVIITLFIAVVGWLGSAIIERRGSYEKYTKVLIEYQRLDKLREESDILENKIQVLESNIRNLEDRVKSNTRVPQ